MQAGGRNKTARRIRKWSHKAFLICVFALILGVVVLDSISTGDDSVAFDYAALLATAAVLSLIVYFIALMLSKDDLALNDFANGLTDGSENSRPIIMFLRSFDFARSGLGQRALELIWLLAAMISRETSKYSPYNVEEEIDDAIFSRATFVAIGNKRASYGATKIIVKDEYWQDTFRQVAASASLLLMMPGPSPSVEWELSQILGSPLRQKTVLIMPRAGSSPPKPLKMDGLSYLNTCTALAKFLFGMMQSDEAETWTEVRNMVAREFDITLPYYDDDGCFFRLSADGKTSETVGLERFAKLLGEYLTRRATTGSFEIDEMWKAITIRY